MEIGLHGLRCLGLRVGQIAEQVQIVHVLERARQLVIDERERAAHRFDAHLHVNAGRLLDVVARGLNEARRLAEFRQDAAGALGCRCVREERLRGQARGDEIRVVLRIALPRADVFELEHAALQVGREHPVLEALDPRQAVAMDVAQSAQVARERVDLVFDGLAAKVLDEVVVGVDAIERRLRWMGLVQIPEQIVDEVWKRLRSNHR